MQQQAFAVTLGKLRTEPRVIERQVHGIPGLGVGKLKIQLGLGWQAGAGTSQGNACRSQAPQFQPGVKAVRRSVGHV